MSPKTNQGRNPSGVESILDVYALTLDLEWAPDFIIHETIDTLLRYSTKATWFITHLSPAVKRLFEYPELFELGIHPNFMVNSTQGKTPVEVFANLKDIVPSAKVMRTHGLVQSFEILRMAKTDFNIDMDVSILMPNVPYLQPHNFYLDGPQQSILRFPYFWEDDVEAFQHLKHWDLTNRKFHVPGLKIFNFHPLYIHLNSTTMDSYRELKTTAPLYEISKLSIEPYVNRDSIGNKHLFLQVCEYLSDKKHPSYKVSEIAQLWRGMHQHTNTANNP